MTYNQNYSYFKYTLTNELKTTIIEEMDFPAKYHF